MIKEIKLLWLVFLVGGTLPNDFTKYLDDNMERLKECNFEDQAVEELARQIKSIMDSPNLGTIQFGGSCNTAEGFLLHLNQNFVVV